MKRLKIELVILGVLIGVVLAGSIPVALAKLTNAYEFFDTVVDVRSQLVRHYVEQLEQPEQEAMLRGAINGMIGALDDPYTDYLSPENLEQFDRSTRGSFSGIGAEITTRNGQLEIVSPLEDSPAFKAGISAGDIILEIDGQSTEGLNIQEAVNRITGDEGTEVTLTVRHLDGKEERITITRGRIEVQTVKGFSRDAEHHWDYMLDAEAGIGYVRVTQFAEPTAGALREAIERLKGRDLRGLILDLRFNPGGLLNQAVDVSDLFLAEGTILSTNGRNSREQRWEASNGSTLGDFPMVVLVNEFSASASEIVSGALKDNQRAIVLGTRSYGKGSVQQVIKVGRGAVKVTTAYYYLPSGRNIQRRDDSDTWGVDPSEGFYVPMSYEQIEQMHRIRRESDVINEENDRSGQTPQRITPQWLEEQRSDPQLAAALRAMLGRLANGDFAPVGRSNATLLAHVSRRQELETQRDRLQEALANVHEELRKLDRKIAGLEEEEQAETDEPGEAEQRPAAQTEPDEQGEAEIETEGERAGSQQREPDPAGARP